MEPPLAVTTPSGDPVDPYQPSCSAKVVLLPCPMKLPATGLSLTSMPAVLPVATMAMPVTDGLEDAEAFKPISTLTFAMLFRLVPAFTPVKFQILPPPEGASMLKPAKFSTDDPA